MWRHLVIAAHTPARGRMTGLTGKAPGDIETRGDIGDQRHGRDTPRTAVFQYYLGGQTGVKIKAADAKLDPLDDRNVRGQT